MKERTFYIMERIFLFILFSTIIISCKNPTSQNNNWQLRTDFAVDASGDMFCKQEGNIKYTFYSNVDIAERDSVIKKIKKYFAENLAIIKEDKFEDTADIILARNREDMIKFVGGPISGATITITDEYIKQKTIFCIGGLGKNPLKHEIMHLVSKSKWGGHIDNSMKWLEEGLAGYADLEAECDSYSLEEKYMFFVQSKKLIPADSLVNNFECKKISYNQSAYIVKFLITNYGIPKLKELWIKGMADFEKIYGLSFKEIMINIEAALKQKYPNPIDINWNELEKNCY